MIEKIIKNNNKQSLIEQVDLYAYKPLIRDNISIEQDIKKGSILGFSLTSIGSIFLLF